MRAAVGLGPYETRVTIRIAVDPVANFADLPANQHKNARLSTNAPAVEPGRTPPATFSDGAPVAAKREADTAAGNEQDLAPQSAMPAPTSSSARRRPDRRSNILRFGGSGAPTPLPFGPLSHSLHLFATCGGLQLQFRGLTGANAFVPMLVERTTGRAPCPCSLRVAS